MCRRMCSSSDSWYQEIILQVKLRQVDDERYQESNFQFTVTHPEEDSRLCFSPRTPHCDHTTEAISCTYFVSASVVEPSSVGPVMAADLPRHTR